MLQVSRVAEEKRRLVITKTMLDVGRGLSHMHTSGFAHGDLTTHNIFLKSAGPREPRGFIAKIGKLHSDDLIDI
jgi:tRNA A-37 threonylcarbamoyl transferase component Bud32